jgi:hypothetical protein
LQEAAFDAETGVTRGDSIAADHEEFAAPQ